MNTPRELACCKLDLSTYKNAISIPCESTIEYCPNADAYLWLKPIVSSIPMFLIWTLVVILILGITHLLGPMMMLLYRVFLLPLKPLLVSAPGASTSGIIKILTTISWFVYAVSGAAVALLTIKSSLRPSHIALSETGIALVRRVFYEPPVTITNIAYSSIPPSSAATGWSRYVVTFALHWDKVASATVERPSGKKSVRDYRICLTTHKRRKLSIRFGDILSADDRQLFLNALKSRFPGFLDDELVEAFQPPAERQSYTELWLKELSAAPKRDKLTPLRPGDTLQAGQYTILAKIGVGGQGTVYTAQSEAKTQGHTQSSIVVLKEFVLPVYPDPRVRKSAAEKFQEEAAMLSKIEHPQIVKFLDLFVEDHRAYLVLERAEGTTLQDLVAASGPQTERYVIQLALQLCEILSCLHSQTRPVIHRDFTPDNLILGCDGLVRLIDFSVAQQVQSNLTGSVVGKPCYLAPEQFRGKPTTQSDIYSLGATMFYLLVGCNPTPISVCHPHEARPAVSPALDHLVARATQLDCQQRYQNANALAADLKQLLKGI